MRASRRAFSSAARVASTAANESSDITSMSKAERIGSKFEFLTACEIAVVSSAKFW